MTRLRTVAAAALAIIDIALVLRAVAHGWAPELVLQPGGAIAKAPRFDALDVVVFSLLGLAHVALIVAFVHHPRKTG